MHEMSIAESMVGQLEAIAATEGAGRILAITVHVGALSGVDPEALLSAFPLAAEDTIADGAQLRIQSVSATVHCDQCNADSEPPDVFPVCGHCGSTEVSITGGYDLTIVRVEFTADR